MEAPLTVVLVESSAKSSASIPRTGSLNVTVKLTLFRFVVLGGVVMLAGVITIELMVGQPLANVPVADVVPELGFALFPVFVWQRSSGDGDTMPLKWKKVAAAFTDDRKVTVIEPPFNALAAYPEKMSVRTPLVPVPLVI